MVNINDETEIIEKLLSRNPDLLKPASIEVIISHIVDKIIGKFEGQLEIYGNSATGEFTIKLIKGD